MDNNFVDNKPTMLKWNWGAFMMPVRFGIGNKAYLCLLSLIPFFNLVWMFFAGANGAAWAYNNNEFQTNAEFDAAMKTWNRAGFVTFVINIVISCVYVITYVAFMGTIASIIAHS